MCSATENVQHNKQEREHLQHLHAVYFTISHYTPMTSLSFLSTVQIVSDIVNGEIKEENGFSFLLEILRGVFRHNCQCVRLCSSFIRRP